MTISNKRRFKVEELEIPCHVFSYGNVIPRAPCIIHMVMLTEIRYSFTFTTRFPLGNFPRSFICLSMFMMTSSNLQRIIIASPKYETNTLQVLFLSLVRDLIIISSSSLIFNSITNKKRNLLLGRFLLARVYLRGRFYSCSWYLYSTGYLLDKSYYIFCLHLFAPFSHTISIKKRSHP